MFKFLKAKFFPYSRESLIRIERKLTAGMIIKKQIDVEAGWILLRGAEKEKKEMIKKVKANLDEIKAEREKTPMSMEKIKKLSAENIDLGWTGKKKNDKEIYERKILQADVKTANFYGEIEKAVGEREYLLLRLSAIIKLSKKEQ